MVLLLAGVGLVGFCAFAYIAGRAYSHMTVAKFHSAVGNQKAGGPPPHAGAMPVDYSLWSEKRIHEYEVTLAEHFDEALGLLRISKINLEVPIFDGTDDRILNRGVGRIIGTAHIGQQGNLGIAGHRDGFFRGLKDVNVGDTIELDTSEGSQIYTIDSIKIVSPNDVSVLKSDSTTSLTLVTCYPFYFIGSAPQRYIVHASLSEASQSSQEPVKTSFKSH
jgi:sortase A